MSHATVVRIERAVCALLAFALGCGDGGRSTNKAEASQTTRRYVAFRQASYTLQRLESPVPPPVAVGSTLSGDLLSSSDPSIVSVDGAGNLVAHRNGEAVITSPGGASLHVAVSAVESLRVVPGRVTMLPGAKAVLQVLGNGHELSRDAYRWETTDPNVAAALSDTVQAGREPGEATLTVRSGSAVATVQVVVEAARGPAPRIVATKANLKIGSVEQFRVEQSPTHPVLWTSTNEAVLQPLRDGLFYARAPGKADVCAESFGKQSCRSIRVGK